MKAVLVIELDAEEPKDFDDVMHTVSPLLRENDRVQHVYAAIRDDAEKVLSVFPPDMREQR